MKRYLLHNTTRSPITRDTRRTVVGPEGSTKNIILAGGVRVIRGRPTPLHEELVRKLAPEIAQKQAKGLLKLTTDTFQPVDIQTFISPPAPPVVEPVVSLFEKERVTVVDRPVVKPVEEKPEPVVVQ